MKTHVTFALCIASLFCGMIYLISCEREDSQEKRFPTTSEEIEESVKNTQRIVSECSVVVEQAISTAYNNNSLIDPDEIARKFEAIKGVVSAEAMPSGSGIILELDDSTFTNIQLIAEDDDRMFIETIKSSEDFKAFNQEIIDDYYIPNGSGKALILAPFQRSFLTDLSKISRLLEDAGYKVYIKKNEEADLDSFRGDTLSKYDIVFIRTHGFGKAKTKGGDLSSLLLTGEKYDAIKANQLKEENKELWRALGTSDFRTNFDYSYFSISVPWLQLTTTNRFSNSWIYAGACESAMYDSGLMSLSEEFLKLGAKGYNGFDVKVSSPFANPIAIRMTELFSSGLSFSEASTEVRKGNNVTRFVRIIYPNQEFELNDFDDNQIDETPFYIIDPNSSRGIVFNPNINYGSFTDPRDNNVYKTLQLGNQVWMAENMRYLSRVNPPSNKAGNWVYGYVGSSVNEAKATDNYKKYGVLYNWTQATSACPTGWHLPSDDEWAQLENFLISNGYNYDGTLIDEKIGKSLASSYDWEFSTVEGSVGNTDYSDHRNITGFTGLPAGLRGKDGKFYDLGYRTAWWSSTFQISYIVNGERITFYYYRTLRNDLTNLLGGGNSGWDSESGISVRCIKN